MRRATAFAAAALALAALDAHALNKCIDHAGKVTYQEMPCPGRSKQETVKFVPRARHAPGVAAVRPKPLEPEAGGMLAAKEDRSDARLDEVVSTLTTYEGCETAAPEFARKHRAEYDAWRTRNAEPLDKLPHSRRYMLALQSARQRVKGQLAMKDTRQAFARSCETRLLAALAPPKESR